MQLDIITDERGRQVENVRVLELPNNKIYFKYTSPYGFVQVNFDKGQMPESLRGSYTSLDAAKIAVQTYLANKKRDVKVNG